MDDRPDRRGQCRFDPGQSSSSADIITLRRGAADLWSDLAFDETVLARLARDGLDLRGVRLTGPMPFRFESADDGFVIRVVDAINDPAHVATLLDLWRLHFARAMRPGSLAA